MPPICQPHNLVTPMSVEKNFGIKVTLPSSDPFNNLVGKEWHREHWFSSLKERDDALLKMSGKYLYFRPGDKPSLVFEKIQKQNI